MKTVLVALIHNNQQERLVNARKAIKDLSGQLSEQYAVESVEISDQPLVKPVTVCDFVCRDFFFQALLRKWEKYRMLKPHNFFISRIVFLLKTLGSFVLHPSTVIRRRTQKAIDTYLTAKHLRAWELFVASGKDLLVVFEDDIVSTKDGNLRFIDLLANGIPEDPEVGSGLYIDLAGGYSFDQLNVEKIEIKYDRGIRHFNKPVTNTACGYAIDRKLAGLFLDYVVRQPAMKHLTPDFLMNKIFLKLEQDGIACHCMHFDPSVFEHGSFKGTYEQLR